MALLIDIGNSRVKWARTTGSGLTRARAARYADWSAREFERVVGCARRGERIVVSSVASAEVATSLERAAKRLRTSVPEFVTTQRRAFGVTVGYREPWRLGVDRFLALIGARVKFARRSICVVAVGTAMTIDLLGADGRHHGGVIIPAPPLMICSLLEGTHGIRQRAHGGASGRGLALFARSTRAALEQGARHAAASAVDRAVGEARALLGRTPQVVLTGGGVESVRSLIRATTREVPDLVLLGLAVWAQEG